VPDALAPDARVPDARVPESADPDADVVDAADAPGSGAVAADAAGAPAATGRRGFTRLLIIVLAVAALVVAGTAGWLVRGGPPAGVSASSVDAGFARDMSTHHTQAVTMAGYERDNTTNPSLKLLSYDIETSQQFQLGQMSGWLDGWGLSRESSLAPMSWMAGHAHLESDGLMPGLATPAQMSTLLTLHGTALDVLFLQLMIHHHQGGVTMARYAAQHASQVFVRATAQAMVNVQSNEIVEMEQLLRQLGGAPLPPPAD
jgi:uncharacterized protein (DUF305 family)